MRVVLGPVDVGLGRLIAAPTPDLAPHRDGLRDGELVLRRCDACGRPRFPHGPVCPICGSPRFSWSQVAPVGRVHSWIRYRRSFVPEFESLVPYVVLSVELDDYGVRVFGRLRETASEPGVGMRARGVVERWADGECVLAFEPEEQEEER